MTIKIIWSERAKRIGFGIGIALAVAWWIFLVWVIAVPLIKIVIHDPEGAWDAAPWVALFGAALSALLVRMSHYERNENHEAYEVWLQSLNRKEAP